MQNAYEDKLEHKKKVEYRSKNRNNYKMKKTIPKPFELTKLKKNKEKPLVYVDVNVGPGK